MNPPPCWLCWSTFSSSPVTCFSVYWYISGVWICPASDIILYFGWLHTVDLLYDNTTHQYVQFFSVLRCQLHYLATFYVTLPVASCFSVLALLCCLFSVAPSAAPAVPLTPLCLFSRCRCLFVAEAPRGMCYFEHHFLLFADQFHSPIQICLSRVSMASPPRPSCLFLLSSSTQVFLHSWPVYPF